MDLIFPRRFRLFSTIFVVALACCAARPLTGMAAEPVFVSILPQATLVGEIGGDLVAVSVMVGPGQSPATYEPSPRQMAALASCRLYFCAGVPFESSLLPKIVGLPVPPRLVGAVEQTHGALDHHGHADGLDPHNWLDPQQAAVMVDSINVALGQLLPARANLFSERAAALKLRLGELDREIERTMAPCRGREFFVFHPAFGHFARRYGLRQVAVEADGHEPSARHLAEVIDAAKAAQARVIVVQPQFSQRSAATVAKATGAEILVLDPLAADYEANLRHIAAALASALDSGP